MEQCVCNKRKLESDIRLHYHLSGGDEDPREESIDSDSKEEVMKEGRSGDTKKQLKQLSGMA